MKLVRFCDLVLPFNVTSFSAANGTSSWIWPCYCVFMKDGKNDPLDSVLVPSYRLLSPFQLTFHKLVFSVMDILPSLVSALILKYRSVISHDSFLLVPVLSSLLCSQSLDTTIMPCKIQPFINELKLIILSCKV